LIRKHRDHVRQSIPAADPLSIDAGNHGDIADVAMWMACQQGQKGQRWGQL